MKSDYLKKIGYSGNVVQSKQRLRMAMKSIELQLQGEAENPHRVGNNNLFTSKLHFMKKIFLYGLICLGTTFCYIKTNAQFGETKLGPKALDNNTNDGIYNTGIGYYSLNSNISGFKNTGTGANTLRFNKSGSYNTAAGYASLYSNTGSYNSAYGAYSLFLNKAGSFNTATGTNSLRVNVDGIYNTANGYASLYSNTSGYYNTAMGAQSLYLNITGYRNTATGFHSLYFNDMGYQNTATGSHSLHHNISGSRNTADGTNALYSNKSGSNNISVGYGSLSFNTIGGNNTSIGYEAMYSNTTGINNTATGYQALYSATTGGNSAYGYQSLYSTTTGFYNTAIGIYSLVLNTEGSGNTASGFRALNSNTSGYSNTADGYRALNLNTTGNYNSASGWGALSRSSTGSGNSAFGSFSLLTNNFGSYNTAIGDSADVLTDNLSNATAIGYNAIVDASNKVRVGNALVTSIGGQTGWTNFSDGRYKKDIKENVQGLAFINSLRPVTYTVNVKGLNEYYKKGKQPLDLEKEIGVAKKDATASAELEKAENTASKIVYTGLVAQEVEEAAMKLNFEFSGVDKPESKDGLYGLRYDNFIAPLIKAVQELSKSNVDLQQQINELKSMINGNGKTNINTNLAYIGQNMPNPFNKTTSISYSLPPKFTNAKIVIVDMNGKILKQVNILGSGNGTVNVDAAALSAGAYSYSLLIDGRPVDTKKMVLAK